MAKFVYKMQSLLNVKSKLEEQAKNEYSAAQARLREEQDRLRILYERLEGYIEEGRELRSKTLNVIDLRSNTEARERIKDFIELQKLEVKKAEDVVEEARIKLVEAQKERKTQEKLRERAFDEFLLEIKKEENKEVDELVSYKYSQKRS
jgi:flagellar FliJ protein